MSEKLKPQEIAHKGHGKANPIADNNTAEGRKMNRKVEFVITKR